MPALHTTKAFMLCGLTEVGNHFIFIRLHLSPELWFFKYPHRHKCSTLGATTKPPRLRAFYISFRSPFPFPAGGK